MTHQKNMTRPYLTHLVDDNEEEGDEPSTDNDMGDHPTPDRKRKLQGLLDENRNVFAFTMEATTIRGDKCEITPDDTPTLEMLQPAHLGLGGGLGPVKESAQDDDTVVFHPTKVDENKAMPSPDSQAMEVAPQQGKLEAVARMAAPTTVSELRAFLGAAGYYRRYVSNYPRITVPLNAPLQSGVAWEWTPEAQQAFEELKAKLTTKAQACQVCHDTAAKPGAMPLCDNCNTGWHMKCLTPPLRKKPAGDWFCSRCPVAGQDVP
jgi:hypothetical protein